MHPKAMFLQELSILRQAIQTDDQIIAPPSYAQIKAQFQRAHADPQRLQFLAQVSPEYPTAEFLACIDPSGAPTPTPPEILADFAQTLTQYPAFGTWFRLEPASANNPSTLLSARWLCHLTGIRHGTAHLLVTISGSIPAKLLVQVRSMAKSASPGCYDLPVAGHVDGLQTYPETLRKESREELDLDIDQLANLRVLGGYLETSDETERHFYNSEYHQVYTGSLTPAQVAQLTPLPSEVAAIAIFPPWELDSLREAYPGIFAPSIQQTLQRYKGQY